MNKLKEHLFCSYLFWKIKKKKLLLQKEVKRQFYQDKAFQKVDKALLSQYRLKNPYRVSKKFHQKKNAENIHVYGETPLQTANQIIHEFEISKDDIFIELGSGRGRLSIFVAHFVKCKVLAIEQIPDFIFMANKIKEYFNYPNLNFLLADFLAAKWEFGSVIFLNGLCLEDECLELLREKFFRLKKGTKIITVGFSLKEIWLDSFFSLKKSFLGNFYWGITEVFLNVVV